MATVPTVIDDFARQARDAGELCSLSFDPTNKVRIVGDVGVGTDRDADHTTVRCSLGYGQSRKYAYKALATSRSGDVLHLARAQAVARAKVTFPVPPYLENEEVSRVIRAVKVFWAS